MTETRKIKVLRIFIGESDTFHHRPLYEVLVEEARRRSLAGATVLKGFMGFGKTSRFIHSSKILRLSEDLPLVIEFVDSEDKIKAFLPFLEDKINGGLVILEDVEVVTYKAKTE